MSRINDPEQKFWNSSGIKEKKKSSFIKPECVNYVSKCQKQIKKHASFKYGKSKSTCMLERVFCTFTKFWIKAVIVVSVKSFQCFVAESFSLSLWRSAVFSVSKRLLTWQTPAPFQRFSESFRTYRWAAKNSRLL